MRWNDDFGAIAPGSGKAQTPPMTRIHFRAALVLLLGVPDFAFAQAPAPPGAAPAEPPIVVTGTRLSGRQARARAVSFVDGTGIASGETPVARWVDPVCITVVGVDERYAYAVRRRMQAIAVAARVPVARDSCTPNVVVSFTGDAGTVVREVAARAPRRLEELSAAARTRLLEGNAPIRWWYSSTMRTRHGSAASTNAAAWAAVDGGEGGGSGLPGNVPTTYHYNSSIISTQVGRVLVAASVVIDVNRMDRMPLEAVASYAAMVAFAEIRDSSFATQGSVLSMFGASEDAPRGLTDWDMAFLRALYRLPLDRDARQQRGLLVRDLIAAVEAGG